MNLIVLRGRTKSGKTTLLKEIVKELGYVSIEIDEIKMKKYGNTLSCNPIVDFPKIGRKARELLEIGKNVVVEDAFLGKKTLDYFEQGLQDLDGISKTYIRLEISLEEALKRNAKMANPLKQSTIEGQYEQNIYEVEGEYIFNTERQGLDEILEEIKKLLEQ